MVFGKATASLAATMLVVTPIAAQAAEGAPARLGSDVSGEQQFGGFPWLLIFVVIAAGLGLYFALDDDDDGVPGSP